MRKRIDSGLWEIFAPGIGEGAVYKYEIAGADGVLQPLKADPFGFAAELRPSTASVVARTDGFVWSDADYLPARARPTRAGSRCATYEVHLGSWRRGAARRLPVLRRDRRHADPLCRRPRLHPYRADAGQRTSAGRLLGLPADRPVRPHRAASATRPASPASWTAPMRPAWASSSTGCRRISPPTSMAWRISTARPLYEHADPQPRLPSGLEHRDLRFRPARGGQFPGRPTRSTGSSASTSTGCASMRSPPCCTSTIRASPANGRRTPRAAIENRDAVRFLRQFNTLAYAARPGVATIAEESTAWPGVCTPRA